MARPRERFAWSRRALIPIGAATLFAAPLPAAAGPFPDDAWGIAVSVETYNGAGESARDDSGGAGTGCSSSGHLCFVTDDVRQVATSDASAEASVSLDPSEGIWREQLTVATDGLPRDGDQYAFAEVDVLEKIRIEAGDSGLPADARVPVTVHLRGSSALEDGDGSASYRSFEAYATMFGIETPGQFLSSNLVLQQDVGDEDWSIRRTSSAVPLGALLGVRLIILGQLQQTRNGSPNQIVADLAWRICSAIPGVQIVSLSPGHDDGDLDGDALPDCWEVAGRDADADGTVDVDLLAMGADPRHKDLFVEIDAMVDSSSASPHTHKPKLAALRRVAGAFGLAPLGNPDGEEGIHLHLDAGPDTVMVPETGALWGTRSRADSLAHFDDLGSTVAGQYQWQDFDDVKNDHFEEAREPVFRYALFVHDMGGKGSTSGKARGLPGSDFIVSLGSWTSQTGTVLEQAGTLMHELGHTLGLQHGGVDGVHYKPNFLSVMNYSFQTVGLRVAGFDGILDYSRFELPDLDENALYEAFGLAAGSALDPGYGTRWYCGSMDVRGDVVDNANGAIDWDCDGTISDPAPVVANVNQDADSMGNEVHDVLVSDDDWMRVEFAGGSVGDAGSSYVPPDETPVDELTFEVSYALVRDLAVAVSGPGLADLEPGEGTTLEYRITNTGELADRYRLVVEDDGGWADAGGVPAMMMLQPGDEAVLPLPVAVPAGVEPDASDSVALTATSEVNPLVEDEARTYFVPEPAGGPLAALLVLAALARCRRSTQRRASV